MLRVHLEVHRENTAQAVRCHLYKCKTSTKFLNTWFHFLCKEITVEGNQIVDKNQRGLSGLSQWDYSWARSAYCLVTKAPIDGRTWQEVTLLVFSVKTGVNLQEAFEELSKSTSWQEIREDPYCLLNIIFESLYKRVDQKAWSLAKVYGREEEVRSSLTARTT
jgi:hypothetical protein